MFESFRQRTAGVASPGSADATARHRHRRAQPATATAPTTRPLHRRPVRYLVGAASITVGLLAGWLFSAGAAPAVPAAAAADVPDPLAGTTLWAPDGPDAHPVACGTSTHRVRSATCDQAWTIAEPSTG